MLIAILIAPFFKNGTVPCIPPASRSVSRHIQWMHSRKGWSSLRKGRGLLSPRTAAQVRGDQNHGQNYRNKKQGIKMIRIKLI